MADNSEINNLMELLHEKQCTYTICPWKDEKAKIDEGLNKGKRIDEIYSAPHHNYYRFKARKLLQHMSYETTIKSLKLIYMEAHKIPEVTE